MRRREFLKFSCAIPLAGLAACNTNFKPTSHFVSASYTPAGEFKLTIQALDKTSPADSYVLPFRGHAIEVMDKKILVFGRRPETRCAMIEPSSQTTATFSATSGRHFYGHGVLTKDALLTTENNYDQGSGVIGIRDRETLKPIGEYSSFGIGPHDCQLLPDGKTLVVANGGLVTHPETGYRVLNIDHPESSLVYIDLDTGLKIDEFQLPDPLLSIRHLSVGANGAVAAALQYQGNPYQQTPTSLVAAQQPGESFKLLECGQNAVQSMRGYMGDIALHQSSDLLAVTSPKGDQVTFWAHDSSRHLWSLPLTGACGVASLDDGFIISTEQGVLVKIKASTTPVSATELFSPKQPIAWDNHCLLVS